MAAGLGYDFARMKSAMLATVGVLQQLPAGKLQRVASLGLSFADLLQGLGYDSGGVVDWFNFRADSLSRNLRRFRDAVHAAIGRDFAFGSDAYFPSFAWLVGHRYRDFARICDHILPLLPHVEIHCLDVLASLASLLAQWTEGLSEGEALRLIYQLFGYDRFAMPADMAALHLGDPPNAEPYLQALPDIVASEMHKARWYSGDAVPSYPVIKGALWPTSTVRRLMDVALEAGHDGIVFQGTSALFSYPKEA